MSSDQEKGLDGIITEEDAKMLQYYSESLKHKSAHWFIHSTHKFHYKSASIIFNSNQWTTTQQN